MHPFITYFVMLQLFFLAIRPFRHFVEGIQFDVNLKLYHTAKCRSPPFSNFSKGWLRRKLGILICLHHHHHHLFAQYAEMNSKICIVPEECPEENKPFSGQHQAHFGLNLALLILSISISRCIHPLLHDAPDIVVDGIQVWTIGRPEVRTIEVRRLSLQQLDVITGEMCRGAVLLEDKRVACYLFDGRIICRDIKTLR